MRKGIGVVVFYKFAGKWSESSIFESKFKRKAKDVRHNDMLHQP